MDNILNVAIVEDDINASNKLVSFFDEFKKENDIDFNIKTFTNGESFLKEHDKYDVVFMDIELPGMNGMETVTKLRMVNQNIIVVFVTNLAQYAIKGYEVNAFDFIVKPVSYYGFCLKLNRVLIRFNNNKDKILWINVSGVGKRKINISDLKYVEVIKHNIIYHTLHGDFQTRDTMQNVIENINDSRFVLCNRCYLVNLKFVSEIRQWSTIVGGDELQISHLKKKEFINEVNRYLSLRGNNS